MEQETMKEGREQREARKALWSGEAEEQKVGARECWGVMFRGGGGEGGVKRGAEGGVRRWKRQWFCEKKDEAGKRERCRVALCLGNVLE